MDRGGITGGDKGFVSFARVEGRGQKVSIRGAW